MYDGSYNAKNTAFREKVRAFLEPTSTRIILVIVFVSLFLILPIALGVYNARFSATIKLNVAPYDAKIVIGERTAGASGTVRIEPGNYTVVVTRVGFFSYAEEVSLNDGDEVTITAALESSDESTENWYAEHERDDSIAAGMVTEEIGEQADEYARKYPISTILPILEDYYRLDYGACQETDDEFCIFITSLASARSRAANRLMGISGYDPAQYHIEYLQYYNPFSSVVVSPNGNGVQITDLIGATAALDALISPFVADGYKFSVGEVEAYGDDYPSYAIGKITHYIADGSTNTYKVILQFREDGWKVVAAPKLVYSYLDYPNLPKDVIFRANH